jgi:exodeoxyribonuclease V alpha subunit
MNQNPELESLNGQITAVKFRSQANDFHISEVITKSSSIPVTVKSNNAPIWPGMQITATGSWTSDPIYGRQFIAKHTQTRSPITTKGLIAYLSSGAFRKVGKVTAERLVAAFGLEIGEIIETNPQRLCTLKGITKKLPPLIQDDWKKAKQNHHENRLFLHGLGASVKQINALTSIYSSDAADVVRSNPYILCTDVRGFGFIKADTLARSMGLELNATARIQAGVYEVIRLARKNEGHCLMPTDELIRKSSIMLGIDMATVETTLRTTDASFLKRTTFENRDAYAISWIFEQEAQVAERLRRMTKMSPPWKIANLDSALSAAQHHSKRLLSLGQKNAFLGILKSPVSVLSGGPGVGKTTVLKAILHALKNAKMTPALAAPTGRAAMNIINATGMEASTIHALLEPKHDGRFTYNAKNRLNCDVLLVDEMSMTDISLFYDLIMALPNHASLIMIGDINQLEPVGPGKPFADIIASGTIAVFTLTEIQRQAAGSNIITNCQRILQGEQLDIETDPLKSDFLFFRAKEPDAILDRILDLTTRAIPSFLKINPLEDIQIISPMNVRTLGTSELQGPLQHALNPYNHGPQIQTNWANFRPGDKVVHIRNNYTLGVRNGEIGIITSIDPDKKTLTTKYIDRLVSYGSDTLSELRLAYAISVHKSQGSEYPAVIMPIILQHRFMLRRRLLLTACSRPRRLMVLVGHIDALDAAIKNTREDIRYTRLRELLEAA